MKRFRFHHHRHTGKLLHHRHTHYPVLVALVAVTAVLAFLTGQMARADDLLVTATVPAPMPSGAPVFTSPDDGSVTSEPVVTFKGTCPVITPAVSIVLFEGSQSLGSDTCSPSGTFTVAASLSHGPHTVIATVYTITHEAGQSSAPLHITYTPASPTPGDGTPGQSGGNGSNSGSGSTGPGTTPPTGTTPSQSPLNVTADQLFLTYSRKLPAEWRGRFSGGTAPYTVTVFWGDGSRDSYAVDGDQTQSFTHKYDYRLHDDMTMTLRLKDASGAVTEFQYAVRYLGPVGGVGSAGTVPLIGISDIFRIEPLSFSIMVYLCLLMAMLLMWRYEHVHYPKILGVALHYPWQKAASKTIRRKNHN